MTYFVLVLVFVGAAILGYKLISDVPSLLHTPLMSGMNALSGVTIVGALTTTGLAITTGSQIAGFIAIVLAMINVVGGFLVTDRMLRMFRADGRGSVDVNTVMDLQIIFIAGVIYGIRLLNSPETAVKGNFINALHGRRDHCHHG